MNPGCEAVLRECLYAASSIFPPGLAIPADLPVDEIFPPICGKATSFRPSVRYRTNLHKSVRDLPIRYGVRRQSIFCPINATQRGGATVCGAPARRYYSEAASQRLLRLMRAVRLLLQVPVICCEAHCRVASPAVVAAGKLPLPDGLKLITATVSAAGCREAYRRFLPAHAGSRPTTMTRLVYAGYEQRNWHGIGARHCPVHSVTRGL